MPHTATPQQAGTAGAERSEEELLADCFAGRSEAFAVLVRRHKREILAFASRFCDTPEEVDDLGQEIFCKAFESLGGFKRKSSFRTWLYRIAANACVDHMRQARVRTARQRPLLATDQPTAEYGSSSSVESRLDCRRLLARLSPKDRLVVTLLYMEGCSVKEAAALSGLSAANVRVRAFRARARLRGLLEDQEEQHG